MHLPLARDLHGVLMAGRTAPDRESGTSARETRALAPPGDRLMTEEEHLDAMAGARMLGTILIAVAVLSVVGFVCVLFAVFY